MVQFQYNDTMNRYDVKVPFSLAGESSMVTIAAMSEQNRITLHREVSIKLLRQVLLSWDEYEHQMTKELDDLFEDKGNKKKGDK